MLILVQQPTIMSVIVTKTTIEVNGCMEMITVGYIE